MGKFAIVKLPLMEKILERLGPNSDLASKFLKNKSNWSKIVQEFRASNPDRSLGIPGVEKNLRLRKRVALPVSLFQEMRLAAKVGPSRGTKSGSYNMAVVNTTSGSPSPKPSNTRANKGQNKGREYGERYVTPSWGKEKGFNESLPNYVKTFGRWRRRKGQ